MDFNNTTTYDGLCQDIDFLVSTDSTNYDLYRKAANVNRALDDAIAIILSADGRWQYDDSNYTDLPIGTTDLVTNQQDYSFSSEFLDVTRVELKDANGNWRLLIPFDQKDLTVNNLAPLPTGVIGIGVPANGANYSLTDFLKTPGTPVYYDKIANSIFLYPTPNYSQASSLKIYFQRKPSYFLSTDTTKQAGIAKHLHRYLSYKAAYDWTTGKNMPDKRRELQDQITIFEQKIRQFYSIRKKDEKTVIIARNTNSL